MVFGKSLFWKAAVVAGMCSCAAAAHAQQYDMILAGGHVFDPKNHVDGTRDIAVKDGLIAEVADHIDPKEAVKTIDVKDYWVTPGLIDLHVHVYRSPNELRSYAGVLSVFPDGFTFRTGVTTVVDAGSSGWRNFEDFKANVIDISKTRVLADLNIVGAGMRGAKYEDNLDDMDGEATAKMALKYPGVIVGIKSAHFTGPEWKPYEQAVKAGTIANIPVMIDYGARRIERPLYGLLSEKLRPGDIYTHTYSGLRGEQDSQTGGPSKAMLVGRQRGIYFDVGTGGGSFSWSVAVPLMKDGFTPDSISTDLHIDSMNSGTKDMLNNADKFLAMGQTIPQVLTEMTWNPAREIKQTQLGNLSVGAPADIAVLSVEHGHYGFVDMYNTKKTGTEKLICQLTVRAGKVVWDLNGISSDDWDQAPTSDPRLAKRWTSFTERPFGSSRARAPFNGPIK
ncbi:amidohydrolase/deacetylase family metallohydrolase [Silvibacterium acidisoli]|uniref:amidohydrolase/deacetylase family metallohydrolase n=1 Tax=Acidobacteriaceae bacterium ZG23-2 TaxID=2883246 RepID=UPI00406C8DEB